MISAENKKLIFMNVLNGVAMQDICSAFHIEEKDVNNTYNIVIERVKLCRFKSQMPYIKLETVDDAKRHKLELFEIVENIEQYLDIVPKQKIVSQPYMGM